MEKKVKIAVTGLPIVSTSVPLIAGTHGPLNMDTNDIFKCILAGASVKELVGHREVVLNLCNYDKDNSGTSKEEVKPVIPAPATPSPAPEVKEPEPVVTEETVKEETAAEEVKAESPEHWMPPQRNTNQNNNNNKQQYQGKKK